MTAQKEEWVQVGLCRYSQKSYFEFSIAKKDLTFVTSVVYNAKSQLVRKHKTRYIVCARLAQLVRSLTANQEVPGSSPGLVEG